MKWISVDEKLPFPRTNVLVCDPNGYRCIMYRDEGTPGWFDSNREQMKVTHWMPLPMPPANP